MNNYNFIQLLSKLSKYGFLITKIRYKGPYNYKIIFTDTYLNKTGIFELNGQGLPTLVILNGDNSLKSNLTEIKEEDVSSLFALILKALY